MPISIIISQAVHYVRALTGVVKEDTEDNKQTTTPTPLLKSAAAVSSCYYVHVIHT